MDDTPRPQGREKELEQRAAAMVSVVDLVEELFEYEDCAGFGTPGGVINAALVAAIRSEMCGKEKRALCAPLWTALK
jgi:hypothetical protein